MPCSNPSVRLYAGWSKDNKYHFRSIKMANRNLRTRLIFASTGWITDGLWNASTYTVYAKRQNNFKCSYLIPYQRQIETVHLAIAQRADCKHTLISQIQQNDSQQCSDWAWCWTVTFGKYTEDLGREVKRRVLTFLIQHQHDRYSWFFILFFFRGRLQVFVHITYIYPFYLLPFPPIRPPPFFCLFGWPGRGV